MDGNRGRSTKGKIPVFGLYQRNGRVCAYVVDSTDRRTLFPIVSHKCKPGSHLYTDELSVYDRLDGLGYDHRVVIHSLKSFVNGRVHTNSIEGFWGHFKRMITGTYHNLSRIHLQRYVDESVFRWNHRKHSEGTVFKILLGRSLRVIPYSLI